MTKMCCIVLTAIVFTQHDHSEDMSVVPPQQRPMNVVQLRRNRIGIEHHHVACFALSGPLPGKSAQPLAVGPLLV
jgi:hypothetical protein